MPSRDRARATAGSRCSPSRAIAHGILRHVLAGRCRPGFNPRRRTPFQFCNDARRYICVEITLHDTTSLNCATCSPRLIAPCRAAASVRRVVPVAQRTPRYHGQGGCLFARRKRWVSDRLGLQKPLNSFVYCWTQCTPSGGFPVRVSVEQGEKVNTVASTKTELVRRPTRLLCHRPGRPLSVRKPLGREKAGC